MSQYEKTCLLLIKQSDFTINIYVLSLFVLFCVVLLLSHSLIHSNIQHQMSTILFNVFNWIYWRQRKNKQQGCSYTSCYLKVFVTSRSSDVHVYSLDSFNLQYQDMGCVGFTPLWQCQSGWMMYECVKMTSSHFPVTCCVFWWLSG